MAPDSDFYCLLYVCSDENRQKSITLRGNVQHLDNSRALSLSLWELNIRCWMLTSVSSVSALQQSLSGPADYTELSQCAAFPTANVKSL